MIRKEPLVEFIGEIGEADKSAFLGGADALLFPIDWPEPFGLVMIEAMACGTPSHRIRMRLGPRGYRARPDWVYRRGHRQGGGSSEPS
jgi:glycosyltransferase involved in cell wall biosynthesis